MKKLIFSILIISMLISLLAILDVFAENYAVERPDGGVSIIYYHDGANDSLETVIKDLGFKGYPIKKIAASDFPSNRIDRKYWKLNQIPIGKKIEIDNAQKQTDEAAAAQIEIRKRAVLKMTPTEFQEAKDLGIIK